MSKLIYKSWNEFLSSGYPGTLVVPCDYFCSTDKFTWKKFFFAYITHQIAPKKVKPWGTGSSHKKKIQKVIDNNVRWWAPGYPVVHIRVKRNFFRNGQSWCLKVTFYFVSKFAESCFQAIFTTATCCVLQGNFLNIFFLVFHVEERC